jgi:hypothetical protein
MAKRATHEIANAESQLAALARCLLPSILSYFESDEGRREYAEWKLQQGTKGSSAPSTEQKSLPLAS